MSYEKNFPWIVNSWVGLVASLTSEQFIFLTDKPYNLIKIRYKLLECFDNYLYKDKDNMWVCLYFILLSIDRGIQIYLFTFDFINFQDT